MNFVSTWPGAKSLGKADFESRRRLDQDVREHEPGQAQQPHQMRHGQRREPDRQRRAEQQPRRQPPRTTRRVAASSAAAAAARAWHSPAWPASAELRSSSCRRARVGLAVAAASALLIGPGFAPLRAAARMLAVSFGAADAPFRLWRLASRRGFGSCGLRSGFSARAAFAGLLGTAFAAAAWLRCTAPCSARAAARMSAMLIPLPPGATLPAGGDLVAASEGSFSCWRLAANRLWRSFG